MAKIVHLDTHALVWLYNDRKDLFPKYILELLATHDIEISPMVRLELQYLYEIHRIKVNPAEIIYDLQSEIDLNIYKGDFYDIITDALSHSWTRDPFDRIIVSNASIHNYKLITHDELILKNYKNAKWG